MERSRKASKTQISPAPDSRGPRDDFYCWKFEIWYPSEDCRFRHTKATYPACGDCFQGRMNLRYLEQNQKPPIIIPVSSRARK